MPFHGLRRGRTVKIPLRGQFERIQISPEVQYLVASNLLVLSFYSQLAGNLHPQEVYPGVSMTTISGMLSTKNNKHVLQPHAVTPGRQHWGRPSADTLVQALREVRWMDGGVFIDWGVYNVLSPTHHQHGVSEVSVEDDAETKIVRVVSLLCSTCS